MDRMILLVLMCLSTITTWAREPLSDEEIAYILSEFNYEVAFKEVSNQNTSSSWDGCWIYRKSVEVEYPNMSEPMTLTVSYYMPNRNSLKDRKVPLVVMLPPTGGKNLLDRQMAGTFCSERIAAAILEDDFARLVYQAKNDLLPPEDHERSYYRTVAAVKAMMALGQQDPNILPDKFGVFGVSLGGILGAFTMTTQEAISAGYFIVAGGDVPAILAVSAQEDVTRVRNKRMREQGFKEHSEYEKFLRDYISLDPLDMAPTMLPDTLRMVIARRDKTVPTPNQVELHRAYGEPEASYYNQDHVETVIDSLLMGGARLRVVDFFKNRFSQDNPRPIAFEFYRQLYLIGLGA